MGGKQSRVETSDVETELKQQAERQSGETQASISLTPALVAQINDKSEPSASGAPALSPEYVVVIEHTCSLSKAQQAVRQRSLCACTNTALVCMCALVYDPQTAGVCEEAAPGSVQEGACDVVDCERDAHEREAATAVP